MSCWELTNPQPQTKSEAKGILPTRGLPFPQKRTIWCTALQRLGFQETTAEHAFPLLGQPPKPQTPTALNQPGNSLHGMEVLVFSF